MKKIKLPPSPSASSPEVRASMHGNKSSKTGPEKMLIKKLKELKIKGLKANYRKISGTPDIAFPKRKLAVFINGCYWHRCPYCRPHFPNSNTDYWEAKFKRNKRRDKEVRQDLSLLGWKAIVIWECMMKKDLNRTANRIVNSLKQLS